MDKKQEKLRQEAANARLVHLNEQLVFPLLQRNVMQTMEQMCHELKAKGTVDPCKVAYIAACRDLMTELEQIAQRGDRAVVRLDDYRQD